MYLKNHIFLGFIFSLALLLISPQIGLIGFFLIFLSSVLIDIDHYLYYVYKKKDWSLKNAYKWFIKTSKIFLSLPRKQRNNLYGGFCFLHGIEILLILFLLGIFVSKFFLFIILGISFHLILDIVDESKCKDRVDKFSIIHDFLKFKKLKFIEDNEKK